MESQDPPGALQKKYLEAEEKMKEFASELGIEVEELDMLLWSMKTGHIPK
jgi:thermostable 8-oxoguanine DNA glycosylase